MERDQSRAELVARLEARKREVLLTAIDSHLPVFANQGADVAHAFASTLLVDIRGGNNPDLEGVFRKKIQDLGIRLDETTD